MMAMRKSKDLNKFELHNLFADLKASNSSWRSDRREPSTFQTMKAFAVTEEASKGCSANKSAYFAADCTKPNKDDKMSSDRRQDRDNKKMFRKKNVAILITVDESVDSRYSRRLLMSNVEQEADTSKTRNDGVLDLRRISSNITISRKLKAISSCEEKRKKEATSYRKIYQQRATIQQMVLSTMIQQKRKVKDSAVGLTRLLRSKEEVVISKDDVSLSIGRNCEQQP
ncbi:hypothetical protein F511_36699 [Dorcoceras hygrometricum]|uniref:Uncharacterized protein n=1 Tax=Dorcoceras hygrometricum TaxID=472368 RepID=A0A2Z7CC76_9LAMI|nr:hypothetical protein F511_36699 [Dorcoceras hygrometricum]